MITVEEYKKRHLTVVVDEQHGLETLTGPRGERGEKGDKGDPGESNIPGPKGDTGEKGDKGDKGDQGIPGIKGDKGDKGDTGANGINGTNGKDGLPGAKGDKGDMGPVGTPGAMNYKVYAPGRVTGVNSIGRTILSTTFTSTGNPVMIIVTGDANPTSPGYAVLQLARNGSPIGMKVQAEQLSANVNVPYCVQVIDTPPAGTYTYSMQTVTVLGGSWDFGEQDGPTMTIVELTGATGAQGPAGVGIKGFVSGYVDAGTFLTLDNIKVSVTTGGQRGLCMATVSGNMTCSISANYALAGGASGYATNYPGANYSPTPSGSFFGWSFPNAGDGSTYTINDYANQRCYRVTLMIGAAYRANFISIERLA